MMSSEIQLETFCSLWLHIITESLRLEKAFKNIYSNHYHMTTMPMKPRSTNNVVSMLSDLIHHILSSAVKQDTWAFHLYFTLQKEKAMQLMGLLNCHPSWNKQQEPAAEEVSALRNKTHTKTAEQKAVQRSHACQIICYKAENCKIFYKHSL